MRSESHCPADVDEIAESYVLGHLDQRQVIAFEDHYVGCNACSLAVQRAGEYVDAMRNAATGLRPKARTATSD